MVQVTWPRWPPCPYMVKTLKNLLLQNQKSCDLETWHVALGTQALQSLYKWWPWVDLDLFYGKVKLGHLYVWMGKTVIKSFNGWKLAAKDYIDWIILLMKKIWPQNYKSYDLETWHVALGTQALQSLYKWWPRSDLDLFYRKVKLGRIHVWMGKTFYKVINWEKLAVNDQFDSMFLTKKCSQGVVCPCPWTIYIYMTIISNISSESTVF